MKKAILICIVLILFSPPLVLAKTDNAVVPTSDTRVNIFDELRGFSARINSFIIPNYNGDYSGLLVTVEKKFSGIINRLNQWLGQVAAEIASDGRYALDRLRELKKHLSVKNLAKSVVDEIKSSIGERFHLFSSQ